MTIVIDWDKKPQIKQTNRMVHCKMSIAFFFHWVTVRFPAVRQNCGIRFNLLIKRIKVAADRSCTIQQNISSFRVQSHPNPKHIRLACPYDICASQTLIRLSHLLFQLLQLIYFQFLWFQYRLNLAKLYQSAMMCALPNFNSLTTNSLGVLWTQ